VSAWATQRNTVKPVIRGHVGDEEQMIF